MQKPAVIESYRRKIELGKSGRRWG